jgi:hypothetical protein
LDVREGFFRFVREERLFCAILTHLLLQSGTNLRAFVDLIASRVRDGADLKEADFGGAEVYVEFTFLRDYWNSLGKDNKRKVTTVFDLLSRVESLSGYKRADFPDSISDFNGFFAGSWGRRISKDFVSPGRWSVEALAEQFSDEPEVFRDFCRFKWSFNIKPDVVVLLPGSRALCVEAKLESGEGKYPSGRREAEIFDTVFGVRKGRVHQVELQRFMFTTLLDMPCEFVFLGREAGPPVDALALSWSEVFDRLDLSRSLGYVEKLIRENEHLRAPA